MNKKINRKSFNYRFGQNLARLRNENGLTHSDMEDYGISRAYYGRVELGTHAPSVNKLVLIAKAFGISIKDLFIDKNGKPI